MISSDDVKELSNVDVQDDRILGIEEIKKFGFCLRDAFVFQSLKPLPDIMELSPEKQRVACEQFKDFLSHPDGFNRTHNIWQSSAKLKSVKEVLEVVQFLLTINLLPLSLSVPSFNPINEREKAELMQYQYHQKLLKFQESIFASEKTVDFFFSEKSGCKRYCILLLLLGFLQDQFKDSQALLQSLPTSRQIANVINATDIKKLLMSYLKFKTGEIQFDVTDTNIQFSILPKPNRDTNFNRAYQLFVEEIKKISDQKDIYIQDLSSLKREFKFSFPSKCLSTIWGIVASINRTVQQKNKMAHDRSSQCRYDTSSTVLFSKIKKRQQQNPLPDGQQQYDNKLLQ